EIHRLVARRHSDRRMTDRLGARPDQPAGGRLLIEITVNELRLDRGVFHLLGDLFQHSGVCQAVATVEEKRVTRRLHGLRPAFFHGVVEPLVRFRGDLREWFIQRLQPLHGAVGRGTVDHDPAEVTVGLAAQAFVGILEAAQIIPIYSYDTETDHNSPDRCLHSRFSHWPALY